LGKLTERIARNPNQILGGRECEDCEKYCTYLQRYVDAASTNTTSTEPRVTAEITEGLLFKETVPGDLHIGFSIRIPLIVLSS
jgi:hypothetical protein